MNIKGRQSNWNGTYSKCTRDTNRQSLDISAFEDFLERGRGRVKLSKAQPAQGTAVPLKGFTHESVSKEVGFDIEECL